MFDETDPIVNHLLEQGYNLSTHGYLDRKRELRLNVRATPEKGATLQGWSRQSVAEAMEDLAERAGLDIEEFPDQGAGP